MADVYLSEEGLAAWEEELLSDGPDLEDLLPLDERNDMATDDDAPAPAAPPAPLPPGTALVTIEIIDRRTGAPAKIERLMLQPQRILLVQSLLDSLAGVTTPLAGTLGAQIVDRARGLWVCEFGTTHHCQPKRSFLGVDYQDAVSTCFEAWQRVFRAQHGHSPRGDERDPWYAAHVPAFSRDVNNGWRSFDY